MEGCEQTDGGQCVGGEMRHTHTHTQRRVNCLCLWVCGASSRCHDNGDILSQSETFGQKEFQIFTQVVKTSPPLFITLSLIVCFFLLYSVYSRASSLSASTPHHLPVLLLHLSPHSPSVSSFFLFIFLLPSISSSSPLLLLFFFFFYLSPCFSTFVSLLHFDFCLLRLSLSLLLCLSPCLLSLYPFLFTFYFHFSFSFTSPDFFSFITFLFHIFFFCCSFFYLPSFLIFYSFLGFPCVSSSFSFICLAFFISLIFFISLFMISLSFFLSQSEQTNKKRL